MSSVPSIRVGATPLSIEGVSAGARGQVRIRLSDEPGFRDRLQRGADVIAERLEEQRPTYGVNTGFGASCLNAVSEQDALRLAANLPRYHGCGVGPLLTSEQSRAVMIVRLASLATGFSGVRPLILERMVQMLDAGLAPCIPAQGSVGASGDLTPLSYIAASLMGEREVWRNGQVVATRGALAEAGIDPVELGPKESLAIMNGTSVMAAIMCLSHTRALRLARLASQVTALALEGVHGQRSHFDERIFNAKAHKGQALAAEWIRADLGVGARPAQNGGRIQERYSLRCAPHVIGVLLDSLPFFRSLIETEINGASDNPLVDAETGDVLHGGNFYGGHVAMAADSMKTAVANLADLMDRQLVLLNHPQMNNGLPENLVAVQGEGRFAHHGFKAMEITASAVTAEALKLTMPASVFSRSTEGHNQDKVSMGSIAARDCDQVINMVETVAAVHLIACCQAVELRGLDECSSRTKAMHAAVREKVAFNEGDRRMDTDVQAVLELIRGDRLPLGEAHEP